MFGPRCLAPRNTLVIAMGLWHTISDISRGIGWKSQIALSYVFNTPLRVLASEFWNADWLGDMKGIRPVKKLGVGLLVGSDDFTAALHVLWLQLSPPPPSPLAPTESRIETFRYWLTRRDSSGKLPLKRRQTVKKYFQHDWFWQAGLYKLISVLNVSQRIRSDHKHVVHCYLLYLLL